MSNNSVPIVNTFSISDQIRKEEVRESQKQARIDYDSVEIQTQSASVASQAEGSEPPTGTDHRDSHRNLMKARSNLVGKLVEKFREKFGRQPTPAEMEDLQGVFEQVLAGLNPETQGAEIREITRLFEAYQAAYNHVLTQTVSTASTNTAGSDLPTPQEEALTAELKTTLEALGIEAGEITDIETVRKTVSEELSKRLDILKGEAAELKTKLEGAERLYKTEPSAERKAEMEQLQARLVRVVGEIKNLRQDFAAVQSTVDHLIRLRVARELRLEEEQTSLTTLSSQSDGPQGEGVRSATNQPPSKSSPEANSSLTETAGGESSGAVYLKTESAEDSSSEPVSSNAGLTSIASDYSGTMFSIQSTSSSLRQQSRDLDKRLKKLIQAALSGNWEAIKLALMLLQKKAGIHTTRVGAQVTKAMAAYEKNQQVSLKALGKITGNGAGDSAKLAKLNAEINNLSQNRMTLGNFLRDAMSAWEEFSNLVGSVLDRDNRISQAVLRR